LLEQILHKATLLVQCRRPHPLFHNLPAILAPGSGISNQQGLDVISGERGLRMACSEPNRRRQIWANCV